MFLFMELLDIVTEFNVFLEQYALFRAFKFVIGVYLFFIGLNIILLLYVLLVKHGYWNLYLFGRGMPKMRGIMKKRWREVAEIINKKRKNDYGGAVVEAGDILFEVLKRIGYAGETLEEQLDGMNGYHLDNFDDVKKANEIRKKLLTNSVNDFSERDLVEAVLSFGEAIKEMEAIDDLLIDREDLKEGSE